MRNAKQGDVFTAPMATAFKADINTLFNSPQRDLMMDELAEQNTTPAAARIPAINQQLVAPRVPPRLMEILPPLPKQLEYDFDGRTLILRDVDADVVVDYLPEALPAQAPAAAPTTALARLPAGTTSPLPMPSIRGGTSWRSWATAAPATSRNRRSRGVLTTSTPRPLSVRADARRQPMRR
jgi:hypothetical protein